MYEHDDPPPPFRGWLSRHWEMWKMTWLCQLVWLVFYAFVFLALNRVGIL